MMLGPLFNPLTLQQHDLLPDRFFLERRQTHRHHPRAA